MRRGRILLAGEHGEGGAGGKGDGCWVLRVAVTERVGSPCPIAKLRGSDWTTNADLLTHAHGDNSCPSDRPRPTSVYCPGVSRRRQASHSTPFSHSPNSFQFVCSLSPNPLRTHAPSPGCSTKLAGEAAAAWSIPRFVPQHRHSQQHSQQHFHCPNTSSIHDQ